MRFLILIIVQFFVGSFVYATSDKKSHLPSKSQDYSHTPLLENRIGLSIGGAPWAFGFLIDYDRLNVFYDPHWSLGGEIGLFGRDITLMPRVLWWENTNMSGFYVGPKLYFSVGVLPEYQNHHHYEYSTYIGIGAEGGWIYRFPENFDVGLGIDLSLTSDGPWGSIKITGGYLF